MRKSFKNRGKTVENLSKFWGYYGAFSIGNTFVHKDALVCFHDFYKAFSAVIHGSNPIFRSVLLPVLPTIHKTYNKNNINILISH